MRNPARNMSHLKQKGIWFE